MNGHCKQVDLESVSGETDGNISPIKIVLARWHAAWSWLTAANKVGREYGG